MYNSKKCLCYYKWNVVNCYREIKYNMKNILKKVDHCCEMLL